MSGSIIDAEKLQNSQFIKQDWLIYANDMRMMIIFNVTEKDVAQSVKHYNIAGKLQGTTYSYKPVSVIVTVIE